jgi:L-cysteate sulfo-lyase
VVYGWRYLGVDVHLVQRGTPPSRPTGNQVLSHLAGAPVDRIAVSDPFSPAQDQRVAEIAETYRSAGRTPFIVDVRRTHAPISALAETALLSEVDLPWIPDTVVVAASAGSTAAGLLLAIAARDWDTELLAVSASGDASMIRRRILDIAERTAVWAGLNPAALSLDHRLTVTDEFTGGGHGVPTAAAAAAAARTARTTGLFLDGTYTGKAMAALLVSTSTGRTCFIHTGGGPTVFQNDEQPDHAPQSHEIEG